MSKQPNSARDAAPPILDAAGMVQIKVWLLGISPMVWRRVLVPSACTLRELHGVLQVAMGWEGIHLYQFRLRSRRYTYGHGQADNAVAGRRSGSPHSCLAAADAGDRRSPR